MAADLKLYNSFKELVKAAGDIELVWFTTFNLKLSFFEKYILSALVQRGPEELRSLKDFEALNEMFVDSESDSTKMDVRVYHDYRAIKITEAKKTSVKTFGINPLEVGEAFKYGVFHPKVCLLVNSKKEAYLMVGSANLSLAAWSTNSECVAFKKIDDKLNAQSVTDFFLSFVKESDARDQIEELNKTWQRKLNGKSSWKFHSCFSPTSFVSELHIADGPLHVWSPYFSDDVPEISEDHLAAATQLNIIPDISAGEKIRVTAEVLQELNKIKRIYLLKDQHDFDTDMPPMVHAKVWLTQNKLATGSWNFTYAGMQLSGNRNNIEAGIIESLGSSDYDSFIKSCELAPLTKVNFTSDEDLKSEWDESIANWEMSCAVYADWEHFDYSVMVDPLYQNKNYFLELPGKQTRIALADLTDGPTSFEDEHKQLLKDRLFSVYNNRTKGKRVFQGVIIELNPASRPAIGFDSFSDFMRAWLDGQPETKDQLQEPNYESESETGEELSSEIYEAIHGDQVEAWFSMFLSLGRMKKRVNETKDDPKALRNLGFHMPGSVLQLRDHLELLKIKRKTGNLQMSDPYLWFLINEGNDVIAVFNSVNKDKRQIARVRNISVKFNKEPRKSKRLLKYIEESCKYAHV